MLIEASRRLLPAYGRLRAWPSLPWQPTAHSAARALIATTPGRGRGREGVSGARVASPRECSTTVEMAHPVWRGVTPLSSGWLMCARLPATSRSSSLEEPLPSSTSSSVTHRLGPPRVQSSVRVRVTSFFLIARSNRRIHVAASMGRRALLAPALGAPKLGREGVERTQTDAAQRIGRDVPRFLTSSQTNNEASRLRLARRLARVPSRNTHVPRQARLRLPSGLLQR